MAEEKLKEIGEVFTYFSQVRVAGIKVSGTLKVGDKIKIKGATTDFEMTVDSMQVERQPVEEAKPGDSIGIKVPDKVRGGDKVYKVETEAPCTCETSTEAPKKKRGRPTKKK
ncbi:MAG: EF-Tu/IF-2/RF-3 family GTPase [Nanoarchaeota archaeon]|nr:EF-Tu/IF-2/RF-3 family GTPase [Nanoarchaeota archaeon]